MKQKFRLLILFAVFSTNLLAQVNGPAGVFNTTGSSNLRAWFEARDVDGDNIFTDNPANGTAVSSWTDKSGYNNHLIQATASHQPTYNTGGTYPALNFIFSETVNQTDYMNFTSATHFATGTAYFVLIPTDPGGNFVANILLDDANRSLRLEQYDDTDEVGYTVIGDDDYVSGITTNYGAYSIVSFRKSTTSENFLIRQNASSVSVDVNSTTDGIPVTRVGLNSIIEGANYNLVEMLVYNTSLNGAQILIVDNYLSSKYGNIAIQTDLYNMDTPALGDHDHDVAGIGRQSAGNTHTDAQSSISRMTGASSLGTGDYVVWGHNNGALSSQSTDVPTGVQVRLSRVWGATETANIGTVDMYFDLTGLGSVTASDLRLLLDMDNDGIFNEASTEQISGAADAGSNVYFFDNVDFTTDNPDNFRFTIGSINSTQTPLPIQLASFSGTLVDGAVQLNWKTASENNNDYFSIERSTDGESFVVIETIQGAGNSNETLQYKTTDEFPPAGRVYYRLKQTDFDGKFSYSKIISIQNENSSRLTFFPHPVKVGNILHVNLHNHTSVDNLSGTTITVMDAMGRETSLQILEESNGSIAAQVPELLASGVYIMKIQGPHLKHLPPYKVVMTR